MSVRESEEVQSVLCGLSLNARQCLRRGASEGLLASLGTRTRWDRALRRAIDALCQPERYSSILGEVSMRRWVVFAAMSLLACDAESPRAHQPSWSGWSASELRDKFGVEHDALNDRFRKSVVWPSCKGAQGPRCGFLASKWSSQNAVDKFVEETCEPVDSEAACWGRLRAEFFKLARTRYFLVDWPAVEVYCERSPQECDPLSRLELRVMRLHNDMATERWTTEEARLTRREEAAVRTVEARRRQAEEDARSSAQLAAAVSSGFAAVGAAFQAYAAATSEPASYRSRIGGGVVDEGEADQCTSDYSCPSGQQCVKAEGQFRGVCAHTVNRYGTRVYAPKELDSGGVGGPGSCRVDYECPTGFRCVRGLASSGNCLKRQ